MKSPTALSATRATGLPSSAGIVGSPPRYESTLRHTGGQAVSAVWTTPGRFGEDVHDPARRTHLGVEIGAQHLGVGPDRPRADVVARVVQRRAIRKAMALQELPHVRPGSVALSAGSDHTSRADAVLGEDPAERAGQRSPVRRAGTPASTRSVRRHRSCTAARRRVPATTRHTRPPPPPGPRWPRPDRHPRPPRPIAVRRTGPLSSDHRSFDAISGQGETPSGVLVSSPPVIRAAPPHIRRTART